jgi:hypothetical protein
LGKISNDLIAFRLLCDALSQNACVNPALVLAFADPTLRQSLVRLAIHERLAPALQERLPPQLLQSMSRQQRIVLATEYEANRRHNRAIREAVVRIGVAAQDLGFKIAVLKGVAWLFRANEGLVAWRTMVDGDLLVDSEHIAKMPRLLAELGFTEILDRPGRFGPRKFRAHFHLPPYVEQKTGVVLEVHRHIGFRAELLPNRLIFESAVANQPGIVSPTPWVAAFHSIVHWQVQNGGYRRFSSPAREILESSQHISRGDVDWGRLEYHARCSGVAAECRATLALTQELLGTPVPSPFHLSRNDWRYVAQCLTVRASPIRSRIFRDVGRAYALWDCDRAKYRLALLGASSATKEIAVWILRILLAPVFVFKGFALACLVVSAAFGRLGRT